ncbi:Rrf2 family transcriptional regulator [Wenzhouxiangella sp. XN79A]|uniref:RrF2 family transcriptional regulator n=1 Tax=Wenzhouxiangella sp. XN79A TaxID=2724193 RepID=UPI00144AE82E|nr:Rrf2 family transcriptional regulator [Wenzhouxiangella sp. XN79A]NKI35351.1 Rrf2 family transcriptional regulator [Wenzhouxiangella sp. XN79A]
MRLTQYTDFSLRVLLYLALHPGERCRIRDIAEAYGISRNHLMKVVQQLASLGFIRSVRGAGGGLVLERDPASIRIGDVVAQMEPDFGMVECMRPGNDCVITPSCGLPPILARATRAYLDVLRGYTLADLLREPERDGMKRLLTVGPAA